MCQEALDTAAHCGPNPLPVDRLRTRWVVQNTSPHHHARWAAMADVSLDPEVGRGCGAGATQPGPVHRTLDSDNQSADVHGATVCVLKLLTRGDDRTGDTGCGIELRIPKMPATASS
jgi:hypothetical protein